LQGNKITTLPSYNLFAFVPVAEVLTWTIGEGF